MTKPWLQKNYTVLIIIAITADNSVLIRISSAGVLLMEGGGILSGQLLQDWDLRDLGSGPYWAQEAPWWLLG